jgi:hypothetical protein
MDRHSCVTTRIRSERREHPRVQLRVPALFDAAFAYGNAECRNVSTGGVALRGSDLPVGTCLDVYFELPTGHAIDERARVVRRTDVEVGLSFIAPSLQSRAALRAFVLARQGRTPELQRAS